jgi:DNA-binding transcriptional MerR regulator
VTGPLPLEYSVDELAREANTTVRNVRAYQDRGILSPPERRGRAGFYGAQHLTRLRLIQTLLSRGYTVGNIGELLKAVEQGHDVREMLGIQQALSGSWSSQLPEAFSAEDLAGMFAGTLTAPALTRAISLGLVVREGAQFRAANPTLLRVGQALVQAGLSMDEVLSLAADLNKHVGYASEQIVRMVGRTLDRHQEQAHALPMVELIKTFRSVAMRAVEAEMSRALGESANQLLSERMAAFAEAQRHTKKSRVAPKTPLRAPKLRQKKT